MDIWQQSFYSFKIFYYIGAMQTAVLMRGCACLMTYGTEMLPVTVLTMVSPCRAKVEALFTLIHAPSSSVIN